MMHPAAALSSSSSKAAADRKKSGKEEQHLFSLRTREQHLFSLRTRLHDALSLGLSRSNGHGAKKWQSTDAGIQSHALRAMATFLGSLPKGMFRQTPVKESIPDVVVALEGILQTNKTSVLMQAADVTLKLANNLGNSIRQYPILEIVTSLSCQLSTDQLPIAVSSASAMNCILRSLVTATRGLIHKEMWEALERTNAVASVVSALQSYDHNVHPLNYLSEMISLLTTVLWIWPASRYPVWSNCNLMKKLARYCLSTEVTVVVKALKLYAALALCGNGAMILLKNEVLMANIGELIGMSRPSIIMIEALTLSGFIGKSYRNSKICKQLMTSHCQSIVQAVIDAMSRNDESLLVTEGCRTALLALRYAGDHHRWFWSNAIDIVLYNILTGCCISPHQLDQILCNDEELFNMVSKNFTDIHSYAFDILGYLAVHCKNEYLAVRKGQHRILQAIICCACSLAANVMLSSPMKPSKYVLEPALRAVLMMLLSPSGYILSEASTKLSEVVLPFGDECLNSLMSSLESNTTRNVTTSSDSVKVMTNLMELACLVLLPAYHNLLDKRHSVDVLSIIIMECLHNHIHVTRSKVASHLQFYYDGSSYCCHLSEDWEGKNIVLFYGLVVLFNLLKKSTSVCVRCKRNLDMGIVCHDCRSHCAEGLIRVLQGALCHSLSPGSKCYVVHILSLFGLCGSSSKLGGKMTSALDDNELVDMELLLSDGESLKAHRGIISARCPRLLPSAKSQPGSGAKSTDECGKSIYRVQMSDRVTSRALKKILEYSYAGFSMVEDDIVKPVRTLAKYCHLKSLQEILQKDQPRWSYDWPVYDLTAALEPDESSFSDIILEAQSNEEMKCGHRSCQLSTPHVHCHKIVLTASCDYLRAMFQSGMHESFSDVIRVPLGRQALDKLVHWFYSGKLPKVTLDCRWKNMSSDEQLSRLRSYVELSSLAEFWLLEDIKEESLQAVTSSLNSSTKASVDFIAFAASLDEWEMVDAGIRSVAYLYPRLRDSGQLELLDEDLENMLREEYVRYSQRGGRSS